VALASNVWYSLLIQLPTGTNIARFYAYDDTRTTLLWSDSLTNARPSGAGRETTHGISCTYTNAITQSLLDLSELDVDMATP
jgi:hypothetical protein